MNLVTLKGLTKQYSDRVLLDQVDMLINTGDRIGLIGLNGSGKTTLLRVIAGVESPDEGDMAVWGGVRVQYLSQEPTLDDNLTVLETLFQSDSPQMRLLFDYEHITHALQQKPGDNALADGQATSVKLLKIGEFHLRVLTRQAHSRAGYDCHFLAARIARPVSKLPASDLA